MKLEGKVSIITGAGGGIGRSIALAFANEGSDLILTDYSQKQLDQITRETGGLGANVSSFICDISSPEDVENLKNKITAEFPHVNILVNNAGISKRAKLLEYDDKDWLEVIRINLFGVYLCIKAFLPMIEYIGHGRIINIASIGGKIPVPFNSAYGASKHGVIGLTQSVASEVALTGYSGITVNAICPFYVNTKMFTGPHGYIAQVAKAIGKSKKKVLNDVLSRNLQHRVLEPEEVAAMAVYLSSDDAKGITGQSINICGGRIFH